MIRARTIHETRAGVLWILRAVGVFLVAWGAFMVSARLMFGMLTAGPMSSAWQVTMGVGEEHGIYRGGPLIVLGMLLCVFGRRLARWIVATPENGCPRCGYEDGQQPCPECGYADAAAKP